MINCPFIWTDRSKYTNYIPHHTGDLRNWFVRVYDRRLHGESKKGLKHMNDELNEATMWEWMNLTWYKNHEAKCGIAGA